MTGVTIKPTFSMLDIFRTWVLKTGPGVWEIPDGKIALYTALVNWYWDWAVITRAKYRIKWSEPGKSFEIFLNPEWDGGPAKI